MPKNLRRQNLVKCWGYLKRIFFKKNVRHVFDRDFGNGCCSDNTQFEFGKNTTLCRHHGGRAGIYPWYIADRTFIRQSLYIQS